MIGPDVAFNARLRLTTTMDHVKASDGVPGHVDWIHFAGRLSGGVALMLLSMSKVSTALQYAFGDGLRSIIKASCSNRIFAFASGAMVCALLNSSNAASLLVVHFVASGDMTLAQALGFCLGINVGGTVQSHLVASSTVADYGAARPSPAPSPSEQPCLLPSRPPQPLCLLALATLSPASASRAPSRAWARRACGSVSSSLACR